MTDRRREKLFEVIERYLFHSNFKTDNPIVEEITEAVIDVELLCLWELTQRGPCQRGDL
ncbi:MAG: hypothetical protein LUF34_09190 [Lachnospiraceae bacterium]|nr:hypothetical protein [Lachnospiraceae bacterium]